nr:MAG TPA: hypothetical protein [Caudoviricetes sp.]
MDFTHPLKVFILYLDTNCLRSWRKILRFSHHCRYVSWVMHDISLYNPDYRELITIEFLYLFKWNIYFSKKCTIKNFYI